jgi:hypothetical protein
MSYAVFLFSRVYKYYRGPVVPSTSNIVKMPYAPPGGFHFEVIPPDRWADHMLRAWKV